MSSSEVEKTELANERTSVALLTRCRERKTGDPGDGGVGVLHARSADSCRDWIDLKVELEELGSGAFPFEQPGESSQVLTHTWMGEVATGREKLSVWA